MGNGSLKVINLAGRLLPHAAQFSGTPKDLETICLNSAQKTPTKRLMPRV